MVGRGAMRGTFAIRGRSAQAATLWNSLDGIRIAQRVLARIYDVHDELEAQQGSVAGIEAPTFVAPLETTARRERPHRTI